MLVPGPRPHANTIPQQNENYVSNVSCFSISQIYSVLIIDYVCNAIPFVFNTILLLVAGNYFSHALA